MLELLYSELTLFIQEFVLKKLLNGSKVKNVGKAEFKTTTLLVYHTLLGLIGVVTFTSLLVDSSRAEFGAFINCEATGNSNCRQLLTNDSLYNLITVAISLVSFAPVLTFLIFVCDVQALRKKLKACKCSSQVSSLKP